MSMYTRVQAECRCTIEQSPVSTSSDQEKEGGSKHASHINLLLSIEHGRMNGWMDTKTGEWVDIRFIASTYEIFK
ncbi:hypothetical protein MAR_025279 [Mya arenaria]|uniref:Uncharacterized protein n=1 Tax=Mya arenaria TaxID=6604 RepID=A0ABY7DT63_MYAAR|nr:hypothetical protein MAR_025279 [Mya arenaria]